MNILLIPTYRPTQETIKLIESLKQLHNCIIIIINNGCDNSYANIFDRINDFKYVKVIKKDYNNGKGAGIKFGLKYIKKNYNSISYVVFADCDGQHTRLDIERFLKVFQNDIVSSDFYIGNRSFNFNNPKKNLIGNKLYNFLIRIFFRLGIDDVLCGLRAVNYRNIDDLIDIKANEFDFEIISLLKFKQRKLKIKQIPISATYLKNNKSNFRVIYDSLKLIFLIFKIFIKQITKI